MVSITNHKTRTARKQAEGARRSIDLRAVCLLLHRYVGLLLAGFLVLTGVTGSIIAFQDELEHWLNPDLFTTSSRGAYLSPSALQAKLEAAEPQLELNYFLFRPPQGQSINASVRPRIDPATGAPSELAFDQVFLDPVTGAILGKRLYGACCLARQHLLPFIYELHRDLTAGTIGTLIMGIIACLWTIDCFIGFYLTLPRARPFLAKWRAAWRIKTGAGAHRLTLDLHRASGLWLWAMLFVVATSGVYLTLEMQVFRPVLSLFSAPQPSPLELAEQRVQQNHDTSQPRLSLDQAIEIAQQESRRKGWNLVPTAIYDANYAGAYGVYFFPATNDRGKGLGTPILYIDDRSGKVLFESVPGEGNAGDLILQAQFPLHSGQVLGLAGRIIVALLGWVVAGLSVTGVLIWLKKHRARRHANRQRQAKRLSGRGTRVQQR